MIALAIALAALGVSVSLLLIWMRRRMAAATRRFASPTDPGEWQQVQDVLNDALEVSSSERAGFVAHALAGKPLLRDEVHSLLAAHARAGMLDRSAPDLPMPTFAPDPTSAPARGRIIGRYEILDTLGGGGMGVVYTARDPRLERVVALKFLPPHLGADEHAKERFLVEAQAAAALDHPNVCTIHEIGETDDGQLFLAMPFYEGETLKLRLADGPLSPDDATDIAIQVARGLAKAHEHGIIHRDIKPANLVVTREGVVKILDFGIAKLADVTLTGPGVTPGTVAYMSPEQAGGDDVDGRTDLWSLGVVLHEMLTGERPFRGANDGVVLDAIRTADPRPVSALRPDVPAALEQVVNRALARLREDRFATAPDMVNALEAVPVAAAGDAAAGSRPARVVEPMSDPSAVDVLGEGERRPATIVACTLSGYEALVGDLVPAEMDRLARRIRVEAAAVAERHGGTLNRCAGDEIVLLFGIPTAHEDDGIRAARSALELHGLLRALSEETGQRTGLRFRLHTGIDTGRVIVHAQDGRNGDREYRIDGSAAQIAQRLAAHAGADEVWATPEWHHLIGSFFETEPLEALAVRDRKQPMIPVRVLGESGYRTRLEAAEKLGLTPFTGRSAELIILQHSLRDALRGEGQFVTITGEAGIGKSRLLHEFRKTVHGEGVSCLLGRCQSDGGGVPYLPFTEILRDVLRIGEPSGGVQASILARIRSIGTELEEFIPLYLHLLSIHSSEFRVPGHLQGDTLRLAIEEALAALLTLSTRRQPVVVLLEDWHWADDASRSALEQVAELVSGYPLLVVVTSRSGYGVRWGTPGQHTAIPLRPLDAGSLVAMLKSFLRVQSFPQDLGALFHERTGGNPFFLEETCMALLEDGAIRIEGGEARPTGPLQLLDLPDSIEAVIRARLDRLDRPSRDVLRLASVVGREFTRATLERTVTDSEGLPAALEKLKAAGLVQQAQIVPEVLYRFKHVLTQEVVYASLLEHQRRDLHGRVGARIEEIGQDRIEDHLDRLAHHFSRAEEWPKAVLYGMRSAERAAALAQYAEALQVLDRTRRWLIHFPEGSAREDALLEILLQQERLCETLGQRDRQQQIISELIGLLGPDGDRARLAEVYLRQGDVCTLLRRFDEGEEALQRSLRIQRELADQTGEQKALRSLGLLRWFQGRNREAFICIAEVVAMDRERNDVGALVGDLSSLANALKALGEATQASARLEEGLAIAEEAIINGSPIAGDLRVKQAYILNGLALLHREAGDLDAALECLERAGRIAEVKRLPVYLPYHHAVAAHVYLQLGRIEQGLARYRIAVELVRKSKYVPGLSQTLLMQGQVLLGLNRYDEALPCLEEAAALFAQLQDRETEARTWSDIASAYDGTQDHAGAIAAWTRTRVMHKQIGNAAGELAALEGLGAATRRHTAEPSLAIACYHEAVQLAQAMENHGAEGRLLNTVGILEWTRGEYARALPHYERALTIFRDLHDTANAGLMLNSVGITLKQLGQTAEARNRFEEAVALHRETGQRQLEGHALAALGDISEELGDTVAAIDCYERSLEIRRGIADHRGEGWMLYNLARCGGPGQPNPERVKRASQIAHGCGDQELATACEALRHISG
jgi:tetratricopeptide (TPR) repeat protein/class 3 adenylate cyclase